MADAKFTRLTENKIEKSRRNFEAFHNNIKRALKGEYDVVIEKPEHWHLKVNEISTIRKIWSLEEGKEYYQLWKQVFYLANPGTYYYETVDQNVYMRWAEQHEKGDRTWAENNAKAMKIDIVE